MRIAKLILFLLIAGFLTSCKGPTDPGNGNECDSSNGPLCPPPLPDSIEMLAPKSETTYWDDQAIACEAGITSFNDDIKWFVDGELTDCVDGKLEGQFSAGEHDVEVRGYKGDDSVKDATTITVKEGFSVSLDKPKSGAEFFVGDQVSCSATITPEKYAEHLEITVNGESCTNGGRKLSEAGETTVRAFATIDGRTEFADAVVTAKQAVAGTVYPLTSNGVQNGAGFQVTLRADGEVIDAETDNEGNFFIKSDRISELGSEEVELEVAESGNFYGSKAVLPASELLALVESDELGFILAPRNWHIRDGKLSGNSAKLQLKAAFTRVVEDDAGSSFYMLVKVFGKYMYVSVPPDRRPFPEAFNHQESSVEITKSDSTVFWDKTDGVLEPSIGRGDLFASTTIDEVPTTNDGVQIRAHNVKNGSFEVTSIDKSGISGGRIELYINEFGKPFQIHEQIHSLSFGHASQWGGIMTSEGVQGPNGVIRVPGEFKELPTIDDVAHIQVYMDAFDLQFEEDISFAVLEWQQALDIEGLPETTSSQAKVAGKHTGSHYYETVECWIH